MKQTFHVSLKIDTDIASGNEPYMTMEKVKMQIEGYLDSKTMTENLPCHCNGKTEITVTDVFEEIL